MNKIPSALPSRQMLNWKASVHRLLGVAALAGSSLLLAGSLRANTELDVATGLASGSDLAAGTSYTGGTAPTATNDVTFTAAGTYTSPYQFNSVAQLGTFNDLSATALTITGTAPRLNGGTDSVAGSAAGDLLFVGNGANLTFTAGITLGLTGNFDVAGTGTATINGNIADGSSGIATAPGANSFGIIKTGTGNLVLGVNNTFTGGVTVNAGTVTLNFGPASYGTVRGAITVNAGGTLTLAKADSIGYSDPSGGNGNSVTQLTINGGTINNTSGGNNGFVANLTMTGGTFSSTGGAFNINPGASNAPGITTNASATTALISTNVVQRNAGASLVFTTAAGTTASGSDLTVSGVISGGGITKAGAGTMLLTATNTYTGATTVNAGRLLLANGGSLAAASAVTVTGTGTTFGGSGTVGGTVNIGNGSILTARNGTGTTSTVGALTTGALTLQTGSTFNALLASNTSFSTLSAGNTTTAIGGAAFTISLTPGATFTNGQVIELITSPVSGTFTNTFATAGNYRFTADYTNAPDLGAFAVDVSPIPEPSTWAALVSMAGMAGFAYRRRARA